MIISKTEYTKLFNSWDALHEVCTLILRDANGDAGYIVVTFDAVTIDEKSFFVSQMRAVDDYYIDDREALANSRDELKSKFVEAYRFEDDVSMHLYITYLITKYVSGIVAFTGRRL